MSNRRPNNFRFYLLLVFFLILLAELGFRAAGSLIFKIPFFRQSEVILAYYPELGPFVKKEVLQNDGSKKRVLILGGSVVTNSLCDLSNEISAKRTSGKPLEIFNLARYAHNSMDSWLKYAALKNYQFDYVFVYNGINDNRANNCPDDVFNPDYRHIEFYNDIYVINRHKEIDFFALPFYMDYIYNKLCVKLGVKKVIPREYFVLNKRLLDGELNNDTAKQGTPAWYLNKEIQGRPDSIVSVDMQNVNREWLKGGADIKSAAVFKRNFENIVHLSNKKNEQLIFSTYAFYLPDDYTLKKFLYEDMDFGEQKWPVELYGLPGNVKKGVETHNSIVKEIVTNNRGIIFLNFDSIIPHNKNYFNDVCHLTPLGCSLLSRQLEGAIQVY